MRMFYNYFDKEMDIITKILYREMIIKYSNYT